MGIQRAAVLYPVNSTGVDDGGGSGDINLLDSAEAGANDDTQTVQATHTQDNVERTFDPATGGVTTVNEVGAGTLQFGWAIPLASGMTPADDTNCNAVLTTGTLTINLQAAINQSGGTYVAGNYGPTWKCALWRYNPSTDAQALIESVASVSTPTWNITPATGDLGDFKAVALTLAIDPLVEFADGEILVLEIGLNTGTIPNPTLGTATWTYTLRVDNSGTNITFAAGQGIRQACVLSSDSVGAGVPTLGALEVALSRSLVGDGIPTMSRVAVAAKSFTLEGAGVVTHLKAAAVFPPTAVGDGVVTMIKVSVAAKSFDVAGDGVVTRVLDVGLDRDAVGDGVVTESHVNVASKTFSLVGEGVVTETHPVQAFRAFTLVGEGVVSGTIELPIDKLPTEGGVTTTVRKVIVYDKV